ncbi:hypothetical protein [Thermodesulfovibrio sp. 3462-1]|uniref:DUF1640 domain-containing protein n=1 Tax=Thermodesulfovibrio obliviosus TaxID=3118332 RepID=A0AAU8H0S4_9BACT
MPVLTLPKSVRERLGEEATDAFIEFFKEFEREIKDDLATKRDIKEVELRIKEVEARIREVEANMEIKLAQFKVDIIKWVAGFLIAQTGILIGFLKFF